MLRKDLHGYTREQAIRKVDEIVSLIRMTKSDNRIEFITRETVINTLRGYDLNPHKSRRSSLFGGIKYFKSC